MRIGILQHESIHNHTIGIHNRHTVRRVIGISGSAFLPRYITCNPGAVRTRVTALRVRAGQIARITAIHTYMGLHMDCRRTDITVHIVSRTDGSQLARLHQYLHIGIGYGIGQRSHTVSIKLRHSIAVMPSFLHQEVAEIADSLTQITDRRIPCIALLGIHYELPFVVIITLSVRVHKERRDR